MTKAEIETLDALNMTPEDLAARQKRIAEMLKTEAPLSTSSDKPRAEALARGEAKPSSVKPVQHNDCDVCGYPIEFDEGATVSQCKHVIRSLRKKRSDAGKPKPKPIAQKPGVLSPEQAARLRDLIDTKQSRLAELDAVNDQQARALAAVDTADAELDAYLLELQGVK